MTKKKVNKKSCAGKTCKNLCIECKHYDDTQRMFKFSEPYCSDEPECRAYKKVETSCVDGEDTSKLDLCKDHNKNGNCTRYEALPYIQLRDLLETYIHDESYDWACRTSIKRDLAEDLLRVINGEKSQYLEKIYTGDSPSDEHTVITKEAIRSSIAFRGYRLDSYDENRNINDGYYIKKKEISERGWLQRVRRWLAEP